MKAKFILAPIVAVFGISMCSCAPVQMTANGELPQQCLFNNTATGAATGAVIGGVVGAAASQGNLGYSMLGAGLGSAIGGGIGAQTDAQCRQLAIQIAMNRVLAQRAAQSSGGGQGPSGYVSVASQPVDYASPSDHRRHQITPLNSYTDPATKATCSNFTEVSFGDDNTTPGPARSGRMCKQADGSVSAS